MARKRKLHTYTKAHMGEPVYCRTCGRPVKKGDTPYCYEHRIRRHKRPNAY